MNEDILAMFIVAEQNLILRSEIDISDYKERNKITNTLDKIYKLLKKEKLSDYVQVIKDFADSENDEVKLWFATMLLSFDSDKAERIINEIIEKDEVISSYAEIALDAWKQGKLAL